MNKVWSSFLLCQQNLITLFLLALTYQINVLVRLPNFEKNLDQCFVIIFEQRKLFQLIALIPGALYKVKSGIKSINRNNFHWPKINAKHRSRFILKIR